MLYVQQKLQIGHFDRFDSSTVNDFYANWYFSLLQIHSNTNLKNIRNIHEYCRRLIQNFILFIKFEKKKRHYFQKNVSVSNHSSNSFLQPLILKLSQIPPQIARFICFFFFIYHSRKHAREELKGQKSKTNSSAWHDSIRFRAIVRQGYPLTNSEARKVGLAA